MSDSDIIAGAGIIISIIVVGMCSYQNITTSQSKGTGCLVFMIILFTLIFELSLLLIVAGVFHSYGIELKQEPAKNIEDSIEDPIKKLWRQK